MNRSKSYIGKWMVSHSQSAPSFAEQKCPYCGKILFEMGEPKLPTAGLCQWCKKYITFNRTSEKYE